MSSITSDPLLSISKGIIYFLLAVVGFAGVVTALAIPGLLVFYSKVMAEIASEGAPEFTYWLIIALLSAVAGLLYLGWRFFIHLLRIVKSVGEGDPFVPANADRLTAMAWLMLAINLIGIPVAALGVYIAKLADETPENMEIGVDAGGILLILTLFVLARVFRKGTEMRADLEGTV